MARPDLVVRSRRTVTPDGIRPAAIQVTDGRIRAIEDYSAGGDADREVDIGDLALLPGLVDTHVHVNEPGRTDWEGFTTATQAALAGGITTIVDMPLNSLPPTVSVAALREKQSAAAGQCWVDVAFWGGVIPGNAAELKPLWDAGVIGFKCFLADSGVPEFPPLTAGELRSAMAGLAGLGAPVTIHAEDQNELAVPPGGTHDDLLVSRPPVAERRAIETVISGAAATGAHAHIAHLSAAECAALLSGARAAGVAVTAETCPHYLYFAAEEIAAGATEFKCSPPIRSSYNREALWRALEAGVIDCVVSGHSPCEQSLKTADFATARAGIASLELGLSVIWTVASRRGASLADVARWMSAVPAAMAGLESKGRIAAGCDADLVAFDTSASFTVRGTGLVQRQRLTPYEGRVLTGRVERVWLGGDEVVPVGGGGGGRGGGGHGGRGAAGGGPRGRLLRRGGGELE